MMKRFLAIDTGSAEAMRRWQALDETIRAARQAVGLQAWVDWGTKHAAAIVDQGSPLGTTKRVGPQGISDTRNVIPSDSVEIMECLPIPAR